MVLVIATVLCLVTTTLGQWHQEITLAKDSQPLDVGGVWAHPAEPFVTHMIYTKETTDAKHELHHIAMDAEQRIIAMSTLAAGVNQDMALSGADDSQNVYVVYTQAKDAHTPSALYFLESTDGGVSWNEPFEVAENSVARKWRPTLLYNPESGRVWIFYLTEDQGGQAKVAMVSRPRDSRVFDQERKVALTNLREQQVTVAVTRDGPWLATIHLKYARASDNDTVTVIYASSEDNGLSWVEDESLEPSALYSLYTLASTRDPAMQVLASSSLNATVSSIRVSKDNGKTWGPPMASHFGLWRTSSVCSGGDKSSTYAYFVMNNVMQINFAYMHIFQENRVTDGPSPFYSKDGNRFHGTPHITTYWNTQGTIRIIVAAAKVYDGVYQVVYNYNNFLVQPPSPRSQNADSPTPN